MQNIVVLYNTDQHSLKLYHTIQFNHSFHSYHLNNQFKSYIAEIRILKQEILFYKQAYGTIKYSFKDYLLLPDIHKGKLFD